MTIKKYRRCEVDGVYDLTHFGHFNLLRQCNEISDEVYAGVHDDSVCAHYKRPPVFTHDERAAVIRACRWCHGIISKVPWIMQMKVLRDNNCDVTIYGDTQCLLPDGRDAYQDMKDAKCFDHVPRTKAISSTNLIGRILRLPGVDRGEGISGEQEALHSYVPTASRFAEFYDNRPPAAPGAKIVYIAGCWDLLHPGHIETLHKARQLGDYLVVGVYGAAVGAQIWGSGFPIATLHERTLSLLALRDVDDVVMDVQYEVSAALLDQVEPGVIAVADEEIPGREMLSVVEKKGIEVVRIRSEPGALTTRAIVDRILANPDIYRQANLVKEKVATDCQAVVVA